MTVLATSKAHPHVEVAPKVEAKPQAGMRKPVVVIEEPEVTPEVTPEPVKPKLSPATLREMEAGRKSIEGR